MTEVIWDEAPSLQSPLLVVAFEGWFDAGECATGAIQWIVDQYDARKVARIDPEEFFDFQENRPHVEIAEDEDPEIELSTAEREALTIFETTTQREDLRVVFTLQPGEAILANNYTVLHGRTAFTSHPENKRELLRLWLAADPPRPVVPEVYIYEQAYHGGEPGVPPQPGRRPSFPSRFDQP